MRVVIEINLIFYRCGYLNLMDETAYKSSIAPLKAVQNGFESLVAVIGAFGFLCRNIISMSPPASSHHLPIYSP